jgi:hypothetical protein
MGVEDTVSSTNPAGFFFNNAKGKVYHETVRNRYWRGAP